MNAADPVAERRAVWAEGLFWTVYTLHAFLPGRWQNLVDVGGQTWLVPELGLLVLTALLLAINARGLRFAPAPWLLIGGWFILAVWWGMLSLVGWARPPEGAMGGRVIPLVTAFAAFTAAWALVAAAPTRSIPGLLRRATIYAAVVGTVYAAKSLLAPILGLSFIRDFEQRARGALYSPAVGHLILLPALGMAAGMALESVGRARRWWIAAAAGLVFATIALGSRGALLGLALVGLLMIIRLPGGGVRRVAALAGLLLAGLAALWLVAAIGQIDRLSTTEDPYRTATYGAAARALAEPPATVLIGQGSGAVWPWYVSEVERTLVDPEVEYRAWFDTPFGPSMAHPHSLPLLLAVEHGLPGMLCIAALLWTTAWLLWRGGRRAWTAGLAAGIAGSWTVLLLDLPLIKSVNIAALWWLFVLGLIAELSRPDEPEEPPRA